jgi:hypothetical protein
MMYRGVLFAALAVAANGAIADEVMQLDLEGGFAAQHEAIVEDLHDGKTYAEITPDDRREVREALERISSTLEESGSLANLSEEEKVAVFNDQELVNTILTQAAEDSRVVCVRRKRVGSHRTSNECTTVAERERARERSQDTLRSLPTGLLDPNKR